MLGFLTLAVLLGGLFGWGALASISGAVIAAGRVEVESRDQVVEHFDGGTVGAILVRDGLALEGGRSNLFTVLGGVVRTHPASNQILPGITRAMILELAAERGCEVREVATPVDALADASEAFMTGSSTELKSVVRIDGRPVGDGAPGPVARELYGAFREAVAAGRLEG